MHLYARAVSTCSRWDKPGENASSKATRVRTTAKWIDKISSNHRNVEWLRLQRTSGSHLVQLLNDVSFPLPVSCHLERVRAMYTATSLLSNSQNSNFFPALLLMHWRCFNRFLFLHEQHHLYTFSMIPRLDCVFLLVLDNVQSPLTSLWCLFSHNSEHLGYTCHTYISSTQYCPPRADFGAHSDARLQHHRAV